MVCWLFGGFGFVYMRLELYPDPQRDQTIRLDPLEPFGNSYEDYRGVVILGLYRGPNFQILKGVWVCFPDWHWFVTLGFAETATT